MAIATAEKIIYGALITTGVMAVMGAFVAGSALIACNPITYLVGAGLGLAAPWGKQR